MRVCVHAGVCVRVCVCLRGGTLFHRDDIWLNGAFCKKQLADALRCSLTASKFVLALLKEPCNLHPSVCGVRFVCVWVCGGGGVLLCGPWP